MKEKLVVFPYNNEISCLCKYSDLLQMYEIRYLVAPRGWGLEDQEVQVLVNGQNIAIKVQAEISQIDSNNVDAIWITEEINKMNIDTAMGMVDTILCLNKKVLYTSSVCSDIKDIVKKAVLSINLSEFENRINESYSSYHQYSIDVPIIMVMGTSIMTEKYEVQLSIKRRLQDNGYKVSHVGTKPFSYLFGSHAIPDWFFDRKYNEVEKISLFNVFLKDIEIEEKPDVFIVGVPEGIIPLTKKHHFNYGVYAFEICCSVTPDYAILALPYGEYNDEFYKEMEKLCQFKLNTKVDSFYVSKYQPISNSLTKPILEFTQSSENVLKNTECTVFGEADERLLVDHIVEKLSIYGEYQII